MLSQHQPITPHTYHLRDPPNKGLLTTLLLPFALDPSLWCSWPYTLSQASRPVAPLPITTKNVSRHSLSVTGQSRIDCS